MDLLFCRILSLRSLVFTANLFKILYKLAYLKINQKNGKSEKNCSYWAFLHFSQIFCFNQKKIFVRMHPTLQYFACLAFSPIVNVSSGWDKKRIFSYIDFTGRCNRHFFTLSPWGYLFIIILINFFEALEWDAQFVGIKFD